MTQIRIDTEHTREVARRLLAEADRLSEIGHELQHAIGSLDTWGWDGRSRSRVESKLSRVRPESARAADSLDELGRKLRRVADTFEQEDDTAARNLGGMGWVDWDSRKSVQGSDFNIKKDKRFVDGPSLTDIHQGALGDCYLIAGMGAIAYLHPEYIERAIHQNDDGTYTRHYTD